MIPIDYVIGMPLWYAKSVLQEEQISFVLERTESRSRFFHCNEEESYVIRVLEREGVWHLLVNYNLEQSQSVKDALGNGEDRDD